MFFIQDMQMTKGSSCQNCHIENIPWSSCIDLDFLTNRPAWNDLSAKRYCSCWLAVLSRSFINMYENLDQQILCGKRSCWFSSHKTLPTMPIPFFAESSLRGYFPLLVYKNFCHAGIKYLLKLDQIPLPQIYVLNKFLFQLQIV